MADQVQPVKCNGCNGSGNCRGCNGRGYNTQGLLFPQKEECIRCGGTGVCPGCNGSGLVVAFHK